jgi:hypothetical protein
MEEDEKKQMRKKEVSEKKYRSRKKNFDSYYQHFLIKEISTSKNMKMVKYFFP